MMLFFAVLYLFSWFETRESGFSNLNFDSCHLEEVSQNMTKFVKKKHYF